MHVNFSVCIVYLRFPLVVRGILPAVQVDIDPGVSGNIKFHNVVQIKLPADARKLFRVYCLPAVSTSSPRNFTCCPGGY